MASRSLQLAGVLLLTLSATSLCAAQQNRTIRVCVNVEIATLAGQINNVPHIQPTLLNLQTSALSEHKPDKVRHLVLEGLAVPELGEPPSGIPLRSPYEKYGSQLSDADRKIIQAKGCDYVLFSLVSHPSAELGEIPHTAFPTVTQSVGAPYGGADTRRPEVQLQVTYRLHQVATDAHVIEGTVAAHDTAPAYGITMRALNMVAAQVFDKIAKSPVPATHIP